MCKEVQCLIVLGIQELTDRLEKKTNRHVHTISIWKSYLKIFPNIHRSDQICISFSVLIISMVTNHTHNWLVELHPISEGKGSLGSVSMVLR